LELGTGRGSKFFMDKPMDVTAVDLSDEMIKLCQVKGINAHSD
jgi:hypothetical protein